MSFLRLATSAASVFSLRKTVPKRAGSTVRSCESSATTRWCRTLASASQSRFSMLRSRSAPNSFASTRLTQQVRPEHGTDSTAALPSTPAACGLPLSLRETP